MDKIAYVVKELANPSIAVDEISKMVHGLPKKEIHYTFPSDIVNRFVALMK
ncbi:hypothetical protein HMPREF0983_03233 [Erysipelotrichaceae bacterium 3_1_53]|nr:hypothetical protein HMPREF0983_03233 [Erysipelotrichaceae bacterium 3_1_53]